MRRSFMKAALLFAVILTLAGCASKKSAPVLELESVVDRNAREEALTEEAGKIEAAGRDPYSPEALMNMKAALEISDYDAVEIVLFTPPQNFIETPPHLVETAKKESPGTVPPYTEVEWKRSEGDVRIMIGKTDLNSGEITGMTREDFIKRSGEIAGPLDDFYGKTYSARTSSETEDAGSFIKTTVTAEYTKDGAAYTDKRFFYFFRPEYRLNLLISGSAKDLAEAEEETAESLRLLERRLSQLFPEGIAFKKEK